MKSLSILFLSLVFFASAFLLFNEPKKSEPLESTQGDRDNPQGAMKFRFNMIAGNKGFIDPQSRINAIEYTKKNLQFDNKLLKTNDISAWTPLGPGNIGGRIRAIIIRPSNTSNILIGGVSGGIWKSTDGGASWVPKLDNGAQLAIDCMVKDPSNENIIFAGTGEGWWNVDAVYGGGIYKSTDFGDTWTMLPATIGTNIWNFRNVKAMAFDPSGNLYAVTFAYNNKDGVGGYYTNGGLYKSTDGGSTWTKINSTSTNYYVGCDVVPFSSTTIIFATEATSSLGGIFRTTDGGTSWNKITANLPTANYSRIAFAKDPGNANTAFAQFESYNYGSPDYGLSGIYKTTNAGATWAALTKPGNISSTGSISFLGYQGWYDNVISVDPFNSNNLYVGGIDMMKSTNGGTSWSQLTYWDSFYGTPVVHADHHAIAFNPGTANVVYSGNDGGIYKTTNGGTTWTSLNNNLAITQFYGGAVFPSGTTYYGGTQDNGHLKFSSGTSWSQVYGGDGGYAAQDQSSSTVAYEEYVYLAMSKTTNSGSSWTSCISGLTDATTANGDTTCLFISPFAMNKQNSSVLIAGSNKVWLTSNSASSWTKVSNWLISGENVSAVTVANSASPFLGFAGTTNGHIFKCASLVLANGTSNTWTDISPSGNNGAYVRRISIDPSNQQNIYACYSGYNNDGVSPSKHVWYSSNQGTSWTDISGDLPDVPVHSLLVDVNTPTTLYIGTETGVYQSVNRGTNWTAASSGMPSFVPVDELVYQQGTNYIFAFTHGRSAFMTTSPTPVELNAFTGSFIHGNVSLKWETKTEINTQSFIIERALVSGNIKGSLTYNKIGEVNAAGNSNISHLYSYNDINITSGTYNYRLKILDNNGEFKYSPSIEVTIANPVSFEISQNYPNPFNPSTSVKYSLPSNANVLLVVYNIKGEVVKKVVDSFQKAGYYNTTIDGAGLASGIYFYRLDAGNFSQTKKMILLK